jgi:hypothetical protein
MRQCPASVVLALVVGLCSASISWAQNGVQVPAQQMELTRILSKYNDLHENAPNDIQRCKIYMEFLK